MEPVERDELSPSRLLEEVQQAFEPRAEERGVALLTELTGSAPAVVVGDGRCLRRVLDLLVGKAIEGTEAGLVVIRVDCPNLSPEDVERGSAELHFTVRDTGVGSAGDEALESSVVEGDEALESSVVEGDEALGSSVTAEGGAVSAARRLVERMGGRLWVEIGSGMGRAIHFSVRMDTGGGP